MIILYINCKLFPFVSWILAGLKLYETRSRNTLKSLVGKTVYIAETGKHKRPLIRCKAFISDCIMIESKTIYNAFRKETRIEKGSCYDWKADTKRKYLYRLSSVERVKEFYIPEDCTIIRHGRVFAEIIM